MDEKDISKIRDNLVASNPELKGRLSDDFLKKAIVEVVEPKETTADKQDENNSPDDQISSAKKVISIDSKAKTAVAELSAVAPEQVDTGRLLEVVLASLSGNSEAFTTKDDDLAKNVQELF